MFICDSCKQSIGPKIPPITKVVETRRVQYDQGFDEEGIENPPTFGSEIVKEVKLCQPCFTEQSTPTLT